MLAYMYTALGTIMVTKYPNIFVPKHANVFSTVFHDVCGHYGHLKSERNPRQGL